MAEVCDANLKVVNQQWMHSSQNWSTNWVSSCDSMVFFESWGDKQNLFTNLGSCMNLSVAWMRSARCTIDHWCFNLRLQSVTKAATEKKKLSWQRFGKLLCRELNSAVISWQKPAPLGMVHNLKQPAFGVFRSPQETKRSTFLLNPGIFQAPSDFRQPSYVLYHIHRPNQGEMPRALMSVQWKNLREAHFWNICISKLSICQVGCVLIGDKHFETCAVCNINLPAQLDNSKLLGKSMY